MKIFNASLRTRLPAMIVGLATTVAVAVGATGIMFSSKGLNGALDDKLTALADSRAAALQQYLADIEADIRIMSSDSTIHTAFYDFQRGWNELGGDQLSTLQRLYIDDNPHPTGEKHLLDAADDGSLYSQSHAAHHPRIRKFLEERGYYDIFLFDNHGELVYTVFKELDYATNLVDGEWASSGLGEIYRAGRQAAVGEISFIDFAPYAPSHGAPASFMSMPMFDKGERIGVLVFQMPIDRINTVMSVSAGLGETGNSAIVGADRLLRNDIPQTEANDILSASFDHDVVKKALNGQRGYELTKADGQNIAVGYAPLSFHGVDWAIVVRQAAGEALAATNHVMLMICLVGLGVIMLGAVGGVWLSRLESQRITKTTEAMRKLADGDLECEIPNVERSDEFGDMASALSVFRSNAQEQKRLEQSEKQRTAAVDQLIADFAQISEPSLQKLGASVGRLDSAANEISGATSESSEQIQAVASAAEQLSASVREIAQSAQKSRDLATGSVARADDANQSVRSLAEAVGQIGSIAELISDIAEQTNLLALNATIESARAGEAGRGFAVVANEVKALAGRTASATDDISKKIAEISRGTEAAVAAMDEVANTIREVDTASLSIAGAVEEQQAVTVSIADNAGNANSSADTVRRKVGDRNDRTDDQTITATAINVGQEVEALGAAIKDFLQGVRAA